MGDDKTIFLRPAIPPGITSFEEFWPYYVREHLHPGTRLFHVMGTIIGTGSFLNIFLFGSWWFLWVSPAVGYAFAWTGHLFFEKNKPATFKYPLFSLMGDYVLTYKEIRGEMRREIARATGQEGNFDET